MEKIIKTLRITLGLLVLFFGINTFMQIMPMPKMSAEAMVFMSAIIRAGYLLPIIGSIFIVTGIFLIADNHTPLALIILAPISVNLVLFHLFLDIKTMSAAAIICAINFFLIYKHWGEYEHFVRS